MRIEAVSIGAAEARRRGIYSWPVSRRGVARFSWHYDSTQVAYIDSGSARIETEDGNVEVEAGDLVTLPSDLECVWVIRQALIKHYRVEPARPAQLSEGLKPV